jgi:hypothetical protein
MAAALLVLSPQEGMADPVGGEFQVNSYAAGSQHSSVVAAAPDGDFVIAWASAGSSGSDTSGLSIQAQRYDSDGVPQGGELQVNTYTTGDQTGPAVAMDADGDFVIVWHSTGSAGTDNDRTSVQAQRYDSDGLPQGGEFQVNSYTTDFQDHPAVAMDANGNFVITWDNWSCCSAKVQAQRYDSAGLPVGGEFQVNAGASAVSSQVAMDPDGDFIVTWQSLATADWNIRARRYDAAGVPQGDELQVNTHAAGSQTDPSVALDPQGDFVITWQSVGSSGTDSDGWSVQAQRYSSEGVAQGGELQVNSYTTSQQTAPEIAADADGNFIIAWHSDGSSGSDTDRNSVQAQRFDAEGLPQGGEFQVNTYTTNDQLFPRVAADADGDVVITWYSLGGSGADTSGHSIQAQRFAGASPEVCDGLDNDRDGSVDDGVTTTYYLDSDGDGYGDPSVSAESCTPDAGFTSDNGDCDDAVDTTYPDAQELHNEIDDDCDGLADEGLDLDDDGWTTDEGDNADDDATVYPGAPEVCDAKDNDQDALVDEGFPDSDDDSTPDCRDLDDDGDGITDDKDPDGASEVVTALPPSSISSGNKNAAVSRLAYIETLISNGNTSTAVIELRAILQRVDGCNGTSRERADKNDWVTNC